MDKDISEIFGGLAEGRIIPYLGPGLLPEAGATLPSELPALAEVLSSQVVVPHKVRRNLTGAAQYIENFKHRKTLVTSAVYHATPADIGVEIRPA